MKGTDCDHVFDVLNHGEVECRECHKRFPLGWALDRIKKDEEIQAKLKRERVTR